MSSLTLGRDTIPAADAEHLARQISAHVISKGGNIEQIQIIPTPRGIVVTANISSKPVAVMCYSFNLVEYSEVADALMVEYHKGLDPLFPNDADIAGIHRDAPIPTKDNDIWAS